MEMASIVPVACSAGGCIELHHSLLSPVIWANAIMSLATPGSIPTSRSKTKLCEPGDLVHQKPAKACAQVIFLSDGVTRYALRLRTRACGRAFRFGMGKRIRLLDQARA